MTAREEELVSASGTGDEVLDVIVVGGSQAGLAMAWHLARHHLRFAVLEAAPEIGRGWRSRWDSLTLFTPTQYNALPGMPFPAPPGTYPTKDPVASYLAAYAAEFSLPVRLNARVTDLRRTADGFEARTDGGVFRASRVVVATGPFQVPFTPPAAQRLDGSVTQLHSVGYRNPQALPPGPVLVVGGNHFRAQGFEAQVFRTSGDRTAMQARKESLWRNLLGVAYALTVIFTPGEGQLSIGLGGHEWVDVAVSGVIGLAVPPVLLGTAYGIWKENQLDTQVWQVIDERVNAPAKANL